MNFVKIVKRAWKIAMKSRSLWWLGLFALISETGPGSSFYYSLPTIPTTDDTAQAAESTWNNIVSYFSQPTHAITTIIILLIVTLVLLYISFASKAGLILAADKYATEKVEKTPIAKKYFLLGQPYAWKMFLFNIVLSVAFFVVLAIVITPILSLVNVGSSDVATEILLVGLSSIVVIAFVIFIIAVNIIQKFGERMIVLEGKNSIQALTGSIMAISSNLGNSALTWLIALATGIGFTIAIFIGIFLAALVSAVITFLLYSIAQYSGFVISATVCLVAIAILIVILSSAFTAYMSVYWTLCYKNLAQDKE